MFRLAIVFCLLLYVQFYIHSVDAGGRSWTSLSNSLDYRKIFCNGDLPKKKFGMITWFSKPVHPQWSDKNFTSLAHLCSAHGNPKGNMGGMCTPFGQMWFDPSQAHLILLNDPTLSEWCRKHCRCITDEDQYLVEDVKEAIRRKGMAPIPPMPRVTPFARPPPTAPRGFGNFRANNPFKEGKPPPNRNPGACRVSLVKGSPVRICG
ncbi:hypothetical protein MMC30_005802 [Trapelia coarctata]|nr:hypothetical protein [Trapelia coarctata]